MKSQNKISIFGDKAGSKQNKFGVWFDRDISFEVGGDLSADIVSLPRLVTSRSHEKLSDDSRLTSKQSVKLAVVERAMHNIGRDAAPASKDDVSKLDKFLNTDD